MVVPPCCLNDSDQAAHVDPAMLPFAVRRSKFEQALQPTDRSFRAFPPLKLRPTDDEIDLRPNRALIMCETKNCTEVGVGGEEVSEISVKVGPAECAGPIRAVPDHAAELQKVDDNPQMLSSNSSIYGPEYGIDTNSTEPVSANGLDTISSEPLWPKPMPTSTGLARTRTGNLRTHALAPGDQAVHTCAPLPTPAWAPPSNATNGLLPPWAPNKDAAW